VTLGTAKTNSFRARAGRRSFLARCEANDELTGLLQSYEQDDEYYWEAIATNSRSSALTRTTSSFRPANANRKSRKRTSSFKPALPASIARQHQKTQQPKKRKRTRKKQPV